MRISKKNLLIYSLLIIISLIVLYPFFFMIMNSFKTGSEIINAPNALRRTFRSMAIFKPFIA